MKSCRVGQSRAKRVALSCGCVWVSVWVSDVASAQRGNLQPEWAANTASVPADRAGDPAREPRSKRSDHVRLGALAGAGFPRPLSIEGVVKLERVLALGLEYSTLPRTRASDVHFGCWAIAGSARVFPLRGPFFLGMRAGRQHLNADAVVSGYGYALPVTLGVDTTFLNPQIGFLWTWEPGFTLGIDAGLQIPLSSDTSSSLASSAMPSAVQQAASTVQRNLENVAGTVGQTVLPTVDLVKVGVLF